MAAHQLTHDYLEIIGGKAKRDPKSLEPGESWASLSIAADDTLRELAIALQNLAAQHNDLASITLEEVKSASDLMGGLVLVWNTAAFLGDLTPEQAAAEIESATSTLVATADASVPGTYHFLDVGAQKYGDCILVEFGKIRVLIDGSHEGDFHGQEGFKSTPEQLAEIFGTDETPYPITLLVVTHGHQDHIGALPKLVSKGVIKPKWALIIDHKLGFGRSDDDSDSENRADLADERARKLAALLREEDASDLTDAELQAFMDGAASVESKYLAMIEDLKEKGVKVIEYRGKPLPSALVNEMKPTGMKLLGPSANQLVLAAAQIAKTNQDAADAVADALRQDVDASPIALYRDIVARDRTASSMGRTSDDADSGGRGDGMNCQSITLAFGPKNARALLAGDMQFAEPGVRGASEEVAKLRRAVAAHGPYTLFKTTHHTAHNGQDDDILEDLGNPPIIVHTGGSNDPTHPFTGTLQLLKLRRREIVFARTDRNGLITVQPHLDPSEAVTKSRGRFNDFSDNAKDVEREAPTPERESTSQSTAPMAAPSLTAPQIVIVNLPTGPIDMSVAGVDIVIRPQTRGSSSKSVFEGAASQPSAGASRSQDPRSRSLDVRIAAGRALPKLLFVSDSERLSENIGRNEARSALAALTGTHHVLLDVANRPTKAAEDVRNKLRSDNSIAGVVILGGYDVVPSVIVDVLPGKLRAQLGSQVTQNDGDDFVVWTDEPYGDIDGDRIAERPVSRIPDARDSVLFLTALQAGSGVPQERFGIRNIARPFATSIWPEIPGNRHLNISKAFLCTEVSPAETESGSQYFMLHGSEDDATLFTGEDGDHYTRAFTVNEVPRRFQGVVFTGCCWGALTVSQKAIEIGRKAPAPRVAERSIALAYLKAGANAFVGCTGSHYSGPDTDPDVNYALPFHSAFWKTLPKVDYSASLALFGARKYYGSLLGSDSLEREPLDIARRLKNRAQFTCLGLGW